MSNSRYPDSQSVLLHSRAWTRWALCCCALWSGLVSSFDPHAVKAYGGDDDFVVFVLQLLLVGFCLLEALEIACVEGPWHDVLLTGANPGLFPREPQQESVRD